MLKRLQAICDGAAQTYGCDVDLEHLQSSPPTINTPAETDVVRNAARSVLGDDNVIEADPLMASEDIAFMLVHLPGHYFVLGHVGLTSNNPDFDINDGSCATDPAV